jgi:hypothetical protein
MTLADVDGLRAVARLEDMVAVHLQDFPHHRADAQGVLDEKDGLRAHGWRLGDEGGLESVSRHGPARARRGAGSTGAGDLKGTAAVGAGATGLGGDGRQGRGVERRGGGAVAGVSTWGR